MYSGTSMGFTHYSDVQYHLSHLKEQNDLKCFYSFINDVLAVAALGTLQATAPTCPQKENTSH